MTIATTITIGRHPPTMTTIRSGPNKGKRLSLDRPETIIGRDPAVCQICLTPSAPSKQQQVSRRHALITCEDGCYYIADGNAQERPSHNGTKVNDVRLELPGRKRLT